MARLLLNFAISDSRSLPPFGAYAAPGFVRVAFLLPPALAIVLLLFNDFINLNFVSY